MNATQNDILRQFVKLLEENGRPAQAQEMTSLLLYMNNMSQQLDAVIAELQEIKAQLAHAQESPAKETVKDMTDASEKEAHETRDTFKEFRTKVKDCASRAVNGFKTFGVSALDTAVSVMHVKPALEAIQRRIDRMIERNEKNIAKVESIGHELRSAGSHVKNAGRAAIGRETRAVDGGQEGHIQGAILAPLRVGGKLLSGMNRATLSAIKGAEHLKLSAEIRTGRKPSIRQALLENKAEILGLPAPEPARDQSAPEPERPRDSQTQERPEEAQPDQPEMIPLYLESGEYARERGELDVFRDSMMENIACKNAIEASIKDGYDGMRFKPDIKGVLEKFGAERVSYVLATTVQAKSWDQRFSQDNQAWAKTVPGMTQPDSGKFFVVDSHSGLVNSFIRMARKEMASTREQPEKKPSIRAQLDTEKSARKEHPAVQQQKEHKAPEAAL